MPSNIEWAGQGIDFTGRIAQSTAVVASPSAAAETIIASLTIPSNVVVVNGVILFGWCAYTVGTNGTTVQLQIRQTSVGGSSIVATGALSGSQHGAAILSADDVGGFDSAPAANQVYKLTMQVANASATSTVSAVQFVAIVT